MLKFLWSIDYDALKAKIESIFHFAVWVSVTCSVIANKLPDYRKRAGKRMQWVNKKFNQAVHLAACNWHRKLRDTDEYES